MEIILSQLGKALIELSIVVNLLIPAQAQVVISPDNLDVRQLIIDKSAEYGVNEKLALFLVEKESNFDPRAEGDNHLICGKTGKPIRSRGLWQISNCAWPEITDEIAFDPKKSTEWAMLKIKEKPSIWTTYKLWLKESKIP